MKNKSLKILLIVMLMFMTNLVFAKGVSALDVSHEDLVEAGGRILLFV